MLGSSFWPSPHGTTREDPATATPITTALRTPAVIITTTTITVAAAADTITATQGGTTLGQRGEATIVPCTTMGMVLRLRRRGTVVVRRRLVMGLRHKWAMRRRGGIE